MSRAPVRLRRVGEGSRRRANRGGGELTLFSAAPAHFVAERLAGQGWPDQHRFPVNLPARTVGHVVLADLLASAEPLVVAGYASLVEVVGLAARWAKRHEEGFAAGPRRL